MISPNGARKLIADANQDRRENSISALSERDAKYVLKMALRLLHEQPRNAEPSSDSADSAASLSDSAAPPLDPATSSDT